MGTDEVVARSCQEPVAIIVPLQVRHRVLVQVPEMATPTYVTKMPDRQRRPCRQRSLRPTYRVDSARPDLGSHKMTGCCASREPDAIKPCDEHERAVRLGSSR